MVVEAVMVWISKFGKARNRIKLIISPFWIWAFSFQFYTHTGVCAYGFPFMGKWWVERERYDIMWYMYCGYSLVILFHWHILHFIYVHLRSPYVSCMDCKYPNCPPILNRLIYCGCSQKRLCLGLTNIMRWNEEI